ncbi:DNA-directed RNA polymerase III subunit RPC9, partial [Tremellales sp. Uapishka_1]
MKISSNPPSHLSFHEVLTHFAGLKGTNDILQAQIASQTARRDYAAKKKFPLLRDRDHEVVEPNFVDLTAEEELKEKEAVRRGVSDELVWVQNEVIQYLCTSKSPTPRQNDEGVARLANELQDYGLTKSEVLQIVNLAPTSQVELYAIIEETETRFNPDPSATMESILNLVQSTLLDEIPPHIHLLVNGPEMADGEGEGDYAAMDEEEMGMNALEQEFVYEAAYGKEHEEGVENEKDGEIDS